MRLTSHDTRANLTPTSLTRRYRPQCHLQESLYHLNITTQFNIQGMKSLKLFVAVSIAISSEAEIYFTVVVDK
uniref:Uncharacterized protein n=1 Tax=Glossina palpalis gambiensis TaxID=67801 RepID=A0A1B0BDT7_9MUSC